MSIQEQPQEVNVSELTPGQLRRRKRQRRRALIHCVLSLVLLVYLVVALTLTSEAGDARVCTGFRIAVNDTASFRFVTPAELGRELGSLPANAKGMRLLDIDTDSIEHLLSHIDKIEDAEVVRLSDGQILVTVNPMHPVARIFDGKGSYYINRDGKRISADARYHVDVPLIQGHFADSTFTPMQLLPLIDYIAADTLWNSLISMVKVDSPTDVLLIPIVRGQVINFGEPKDFESKFRRLHRTYTEVLPVKGWNYYDTISVKWGGQIVATRRHKKLPQPRILSEEEEEQVDVGTMLAGDHVAPGQAIPGHAAKDDKIIPAAKKKH